MKNRRTLFIVFAVIALAFIGVGYAALTDTLSFKAVISGDGSTSNVEDENLFNVGIVKQDTIYSEPAGVEVTEDWKGTPTTFKSNGLTYSLYDEVEFTISGMTVKDEEVILCLHIMNQPIENGYDANIKMQVVESNKTDYTPVVTYSIQDVYDEYLPYDSVNGFDIPNGEELIVRIVFKMPKTLETDSASYTNTYTFTFTAEAK